MNILPLLIQLASGAAGGNIVSCGCEKISLGPIVSSLTGMLGGELGARVLQLTARGQIENASDMKIFLTSLLGGAMGGAALTALLGWIKVMLSRWL